MPSSEKVSAKTLFKRYNFLVCFQITALEV